MERLSSGKRINSAMDDAAGLTIAHSLDAKVTSLNQAARNANDAVSLSLISQKVH
jgi:flagellin